MADRQTPQVVINNQMGINISWHVLAKKSFLPRHPSLVPVSTMTSRLRMVETHPSFAPNVHTTKYTTVPSIGRAFFKCLYLQMLLVLRLVAGLHFMSAAHPPTADVQARNTCTCTCPFTCTR